MTQASERERCEECGRPAANGLGDLARVPYWFADSPLWNEVMGEERHLILCPACFDARCAVKGIGVGWRAGRVGVIELGASA